jgi:hypothetical protein
MRTPTRTRRTPRSQDPDLGRGSGAPPTPAAAAAAVEHVADRAAPPEPAQAPQTARTWVDEVADLDASWVLDLPAPVSLRLQLRLGVDEVWVTASREHYTALRRTRSPVFTRDEWSALVCAAVAGRAGAQLSEYVRRKASAPHWQLTHETTLGGVSGDAPTGRVWTVRDVCSAWLCDLAGVEVAN